MVTNTPEVDDDVFAEILKQINHFVRTRVLPRENEIMAADAVPADLRNQAAEMGLFGYAIPQEWGGLGLDLRQDVEVAMELGYTSLSVRSMFGTNNGIAGQVLVGFGTDEQRSRWLPGIASGDVVASFALTEPGAGSDPAGLKTTARADGDGWIINGGKRFITNAPDANLLVVFARIDPAPGAGSEASGPKVAGAGSEASGPKVAGAGSEASGPKSTTSSGIAVFLVPTDTDGVEVGPKDVKMGQEGSRTADVTFTDARIGSDALVGADAAVGYRAAMTILARGRVHIAAVAVGQAQRALDESVAYAATATQGGTPIGDFQLVQAMIADMQTGVMAGRALVRDAAKAWVDETDRRIAPSVAKLFCTEMAGKVADLAVQVHGGTGYMREVPVERIYRDVRLLRLYEGTSEIQRLIIGGGLVRAEKKKAQ
ncbi:acyl-CoA dehydrogenase family protein [Gordonia effusa]|nr:acyl-CoA dehydrogenase family protein [Gordonia effusa]